MRNMDEIGSKDLYVLETTTNSNLYCHSKYRFTMICVKELEVRQPKR